MLHIVGYIHYMVARISHTKHLLAIFNINCAVMTKVQVLKYISNPMSTLADNYVLQRNSDGIMLKIKKTSLSGDCVMVLSGPGQIV